ncbi:MAG: hypothetical protein QM776_10010 [Rhodocyclaceae bacterium]
MQIDKVIINTQQLVQVDNVFGSLLPNYKKSVTINFTDGKVNDARWGNEPKITEGLTKPSGVNVDDASNTCTGSILIDLSQILSQSVSPAGRIGKQRFAAKLSSKTFRYKTVVVIVHELMHVHQGWQLGKGFARALLDEKIAATARAKANLAENPDSGDSAYMQNNFEQGARDFASRWSDANADDVHAGKFDFLLPMITMRGIFPDEAKPF